jgi:hypothetical protein
MSRSPSVSSDSSEAVHQVTVAVTPPSRSARKALTTPPAPRHSQPPRTTTTLPQHPRPTPTTTPPPTLSWPRVLGRLRRSSAGDRLAVTCWRGSVVGPAAAEDGCSGAVAVLWDAQLPQYTGALLCLSWPVASELEEFEVTSPDVVNTEPELQTSPTGQRKRARSPPVAEELPSGQQQPLTGPQQPPPLPSHRVTTDVDPKTSPYTPRTLSIWLSNRSRSR